MISLKSISTLHTWKEIKRFMSWKGPWFNANESFLGVEISIIKWDYAIFIMGISQTGKTASWYHDDVIKWKYFLRYWPFVRGIHRSPVNFPHKDQWRGALMFSLIWAWINGWVNNREAGDLRRHRAHYDVTVMLNKLPAYWLLCTNVKKVCNRDIHQINSCLFTQ